MGILGEETLTVTRPNGAGTRDSNGRFVPGSTTPFSIRGSAQPLNGIEAASLPPGERASDWKKLYTTTELRALNQHTGVAGDRVAIDGVTYEVRAVKRERKVIPHYRAELARVQEGGS